MLSQLILYLVDELTPKEEAREPREHLAHEQVAICRSRLSLLTTEIEAVMRFVSPENLDSVSVEKMAGSLSGLQSAIRRVQKAHKLSFD